MPLIGDQFSEKDLEIIGDKAKEGLVALGQEIRKLGPDAVNTFLDRVKGITFTVNFDERD